MKTFITMLFVCLFAVTGLSASEYDTKLGTVEIGAGAGVAYLNGSSTVQPTIVTRGGVSLHKTVSVFGEFDYTSLGGGSEFLYGQRISASAKLLDYGAGVQFTIPTGTRVVPYGVLSVGSLRGSANVDVSGFNVGAAESIFALNVGGGTKVFLTPSIGIDTGVRFYRPTGGGYLARATAGVFFQFGK